MVYNAKEQILRAKFFYGYWNSYGITQDQSTMNRVCNVESYRNKHFPNTSLTKTSQPLCLNNNKKGRMPTMDHCKYSLFFAIFLQKSQFLLDTLVPLLPLEFSKFSKHCVFSNFSQFLLLRANVDISLICNKHFRHQELGHRLVYVPLGLKDGYA